MRLIRCFLATLGTLLMVSSVSAQNLGTATPEPTRWTSQPTTLDASDNPPSVSQSGFPTFAATAASDVDQETEPSSENMMARPVVTITSSLAVVLGLFAVMVWLTRRFGARGLNQAALPREVLQSLGTAPLDARTRLTMLRCGNRILILAQSATGVHPISEITDPEEVRQLTAACLGDAKNSFVSTLQSIESEPVPAGFTGGVERTVTPRKRSRLFATA